jgi:hypothetical protein|tara:strand:- start:206 stop:829 length:624 start_codon:yes stop_codon:yes gene_type:complete
MAFKKNKYTVIKSAISKDLALFIYNYFLMKRNVADILFKEKYISPFETMFGTWSDEQIPGTYSHYADIVMETLLLKLNDLMNKKTKLKLYPNYSYARIYKKGDVLKRHKDRFSCEISTTLNLGGDVWPIYLEPSGQVNKKGKKIILNPGDMLIYRGVELEHWREPFEGTECAQVFLHYNDSATKGAEKNIYDKRITLGLPSYFKRNE